jgi:indole-3-glycerol phosphate synthase
VEKKEKQRSLNPRMGDILDTFVYEVRTRLLNGYYKTSDYPELDSKRLTEAIIKRKDNAIIAELKPASPSAGILKKDFHVEETAIAMQRGGAVGISVLTVPEGFNGQLNNIALTRSVTQLPILMKDFVINKEQIEAGRAKGANAILLIYSLFKRGYTDVNLDAMITHIHRFGLEVLLEVHTEREYEEACKTSVDMIGINNRNLKTLTVNLEVTRKLLSLGKPRGKVLISESGITSPEDINSLKNLGVDAFLVGSSIMRSNNIKDTVKRLVMGR